MEGCGGGGKYCRKKIACSIGIKDLREKSTLYTQWKSNVGNFFFFCVEDFSVPLVNLNSLEVGLKYLHFFFLYLCILYYRRLKAYGLCIRVWGNYNSGSPSYKSQHDREAERLINDFPLTYKFQGLKKVGEGGNEKINLKVYLQFNVDILA